VLPPTYTITNAPITHRTYRSSSRIAAARSPNHGRSFQPINPQKGEKGRERVVPNDGRKRGNDGGEKYWRKRSPLLAIRKRGGGLSGYGEAEMKTAGTGEEEKLGERKEVGAADRGSKEAFW
jgi:hypothetical protein